MRRQVHISNRGASPQHEGTHFPMSLTAPERETIITLNDEDETAEVWTAQRPWITKLKRNPAATLLEEGIHDGSVSARFELPKELVTCRSVRRVGRELTDEEKGRNADRLARARKSRAAA